MSAAKTETIKLAGATGVTALNQDFKLHLVAAHSIKTFK